MQSGRSSRRALPRKQAATGDARPSREALLAARDRGIADVIAPQLKVLFCGINPGLYSGATGHHFARPGNRFWPALHAAGFTPRLLQAAEQRELLPLGFGVLFSACAHAQILSAPQEYSTRLAGGVTSARNF